MCWKGVVGGRGRDCRLDLTNSGAKLVRTCSWGLAEWDWFPEVVRLVDFEEVSRDSGREEG